MWHCEIPDLTDKGLYGRLQILHHATEEPVFGLGLIEEVRHRGYDLSQGTLFRVTCLSAVCPGCVKTFLAAETAKNRAENRAHT